MEIILNVTTEDGELLDRIHVTVTEDRERPFGPFGADSIRCDLEDAAHIVQARAKAAV